MLMCPTGLKIFPSPQVQISLHPPTSFARPRGCPIRKGPLESPPKTHWSPICTSHSVAYRLGPVVRMFRFAKGVAISAIRPYLQRFIAEESLDADLVSFGLNGSLELRDVKLNIGDLLKSSGVALPVQITGAYVDRLCLSVSWMNLLSAPISVELSGLYVVASTTRTVAGEDVVEGPSWSRDGGQSEISCWRGAGSGFFNALAKVSIWWQMLN